MRTMCCISASSGAISFAPRAFRFRRGHDLALVSGARASRPAPLAEPAHRVEPAADRAATRSDARPRPPRRPAGRRRLSLSLRLQYFFPLLAGRPPADLDSMRLEPLVGLRHAVATIVTQPDQSVLTALVILMVLVGARLAFRSVWLAGLAATGAVSLLFLSSFGDQSVHGRRQHFRLGAHRIHPGAGTGCWRRPSCSPR